MTRIGSPYTSHIGSMLRIGLLTGLSFVNSQGREACQPSKSPRNRRLTYPVLKSGRRLAYYDFWPLEVLVGVYV